MSHSKMRKNVSFVYEKRISEPAAHGAHECRGGGGKCHDTPCHIYALKAFVRNFSSLFCMRVALAVALRCVHLLRTNPLGILSLTEIVGEKQLIVRVEAVRLGLFGGLFTGGFSILHCWLRRVLGESDMHQGMATALAGGVAGLSVLTQTTDNRRTLGMYTFVRLLQCVYNEAKRLNYLKPIPHGDALTFIIASAQIMYAYVMRPETLPPSYHKFIVRSGPVHMNILNAVRDNCRGRPLDLTAVNEYVQAHNPGLSIVDAMPKIVGCDVVHPMEHLCSKNFLRVFVQTWKRIFPLYASITFVPIVVLQLFKLLRSPLTVGGNGLLSASRSTCFLATFCAGYQGVICLRRNYWPAELDSRSGYWVSGLVASLSIFLERKSRRSELALYALPRAADSLFLTLCDKQWVSSLRHGEVLLFCLASSGLMYFYHNHPYRTTSPMLVHIFNWLFDKRKVHHEEQGDGHLHEGHHHHAPPKEAEEEEAEGNGSSNGVVKAPGSL